MISTIFLQAFQDVGVVDVILYWVSDRVVSSMVYRWLRPFHVRYLLLLDQSLQVQLVLLLVFELLLFLYEFLIL